MACLLAGEIILISGVNFNMSTDSYSNFDLLKSKKSNQN